MQDVKECDVDVIVDSPRHVQASGEVSTPFCVFQAENASSVVVLIEKICYVSNFD